MERHGRSRRRPEAPRAPTTLTEIARRYYATAIALSKAMGVPLSATFIREHRESISCCFIEAGRAGVRLPPAVQLPPLQLSAGDKHVATGDDGQPPDEPPVETPAVAGAIMGTGRPPAPEAPTNGQVPLPTRIPAGLQLPCAEAWIVDLRPPQLSLLIGKVGLRALADKRLEPLHVALLAERARRFAQDRKPTPVPEVDGPKGVATGPGMV
jgi:hypothetical protein